MSFEHSNSDNQPKAPGLAERVGSSVLEFVQPGHEHGPFLMKSVGATTLLFAGVSALGASWFLHLNTYPGQP